MIIETRRLHLFDSHLSFSPDAVTHFSLGNHEADLPLHVIHKRIKKFSKSAIFINTNVRNCSGNSQSWLNDSTISHEYSIIQTPDVKVALLGFLSDEPDVFFDGTFKGVPVNNVVKSFDAIYPKLIPNVADFVLPMTHQSLQRDVELAKHMLDTTDIKQGLIVGGHDHVIMDETVTGDSDNSVRILKSGMDARHADLIDLVFDISEKPPVLTSIESTMVDLSNYEDSAVVKKIANAHLSLLDTMNNEVALRAEDYSLPPETVLSSKQTRYKQTTVGSLFCQAIKDELEVDVALINGGTIKGEITYDDNQMSFAQLKKELPFPTKIVVVPMTRSQVHDAIYYSRNNIEDNARDKVENDEGQVPRRGYLQVDLDLDLVPHSGDQTDELKVALPRNLLTGFCKIQPLMDVGEQLKKEGRFPGPDDYIPALDLVVRHSSKTRWFEILGDREITFDDLDLNHDGVLDRYEVKKMMETFLGHEPADFVVDNMMKSVDQDENGVIDVGELSFLIATMEREDQWRKF